MRDGTTDNSATDRDRTARPLRHILIVGNLPSYTRARESAQYRTSAGNFTAAEYAALIAAVPDLLSELRMALAWIEEARERGSNMPCERTLIAGRRAIAKAEGRL